MSLAALSLLRMTFREGPLARRLFVPWLLLLASSVSADVAWEDVRVPKPVRVDQRASVEGPEQTTLGEGPGKTPFPVMPMPKGVQASLYEVYTANHEVLLAMYAKASSRRPRPPVAEELRRLILRVDNAMKGRPIDFQRLDLALYTVQRAADDRITPAAAAKNAQIRACFDPLTEPEICINANDELKDKNNILIEPSPALREFRRSFAADRGGASR